MTAFDGVPESTPAGLTEEIATEGALVVPTVSARASIHSASGSRTYRAASSYIRRRGYAIWTLAMFAGLGAVAAEPLFNGTPTRSLLLIMVAVGMSFGFIFGSFTKRPHWSTGVVVWNALALAAGGGLGWLYFRRLDGVAPSDPRIQYGLGAAGLVIACALIARWWLRRSKK